MQQVTNPICCTAKLDELLHAPKRARDELAGIEKLDEEEIERLAGGKVRRLRR